MFPLLTDEDLHGAVIRGLVRKLPTLDIVRAQDVGLSGAGDDAILEWAAREGRVLVTQDLATMPVCAYERLQVGLPMPGVVAVSGSMPIGLAIQQLLLVIECSSDDELEGQVRYIPF